MVPFAKYDALVQLVAQMKREGFSVPSASVEPAPPPELPVAVQRAIADRAEPQSATYRQLVNHAWEQIRLQVDEGQIVQGILDGEPVEL